MNRVFITGDVVTLVTIPEFLPTLQVPHIGEYDSPFIMKLTPCEKRNGQYYDLRKGVEVKKSENMLEWLNLSGTVFSYEDGLLLLITKRFVNGHFMGIPISKNEVRSNMMPRKIFDRTKKTK